MLTIYFMYNKNGMNVTSAHGISPSEINKFDNIDSIGYFSIAVYSSKGLKEPIFAFEHRHSEYEFVIPLKTIHLFKYDTFKVIGEVGFVYPVEPNTIHGVDHDLDKTDIISIAIDRQFFTSRLKEFGYEGKVFKNRFVLKNEFLTMIKKYQTARRKEYPNGATLDVYARQMTDWIIMNGYTSELKRQIPKRNFDPNIRKTLSYMFTNFRNPELNLTKLANYCGYSVAYFSRVFKQYVGDSPITHLNKLRISEAKSLFHNDRLSLNDIAILVGFNNLSTFTEAFKKITGVRPKEYRTKFYNN